MSAPDLTFAQDETYEVQPSEIESVLQTLWREAAGEDEDVSVMHVRTLNLLVFLPEAKATSDVLRAIDSVAVHHPGRTITMIVADDTRQPKAHVSIACRFGDGDKQLCGEQITITAGDGGAPLPSIAASLLVPGVPSYLYWYGEPPWHTQMFDSFVESVDRVIVDSRTWATPLVTLREFTRVVRRQAPPMAYIDMQWTGITPWRRLISQCFDVPETLPHLARLQRVTIEHGSDDKHRIAALLLLGWLSSRLGWTLADANGDTLVMQRNSSTINIALRRGSADSYLHSVTLASGDAEFHLERIAPSSCVRTQIRLPNAGPIERIAQLQPQPLQQLVGEELMMLQHDDGFEAALHHADHFVSQL